METTRPLLLKKTASGYPGFSDARMMRLFSLLLILQTCWPTLQVCSAASVDMTLVIEPFDFPPTPPPAEDNAAVVVTELPLSVLYEPQAVLFSKVSPTSTTTSVSLVSDRALFGSGALHVKAEGDSSTGTELTWTTLSTEPAFNCVGATHVSLWYRSTTALSIDLTFHDSSGCSLGEQSECLVSYTTQLVTNNDKLDSWHEAKVDLEEAFSESLRLDHLKGFSFTLNAASATEVWFDQLAFVGDGTLLGAPFSYQTGDKSVSNSWPDATDRDVWRSIYHKSELARDASHEILANDELWLNYTIEDTEPWGGFAEYYHFVPGHGYYNLSKASDVTLGFNVIKPCTAPGEAHLRLVLYDSMHCSANCSDYRQKNVEVYYTFNYVLDDVGEGAFTTPLEGSRDGDSPFLLTGWAGSIHNAVLDPAHIKGFFIGISSDSQGGLGSVLDGIVSVGNLAVTHLEQSVPQKRAVEMTLVLEPFDFPPNPPATENNALVAEDEQPRLVLYEPQAIKFTQDSPTSTITSVSLVSEHALFGSGALHVKTQGDSSTSTELTWTTLSTEPAFNCVGATHVSLWYRSMTALSLDLTLHDSSACPLGEQSDCLVSYTTKLLTNDEALGGWSEAKVALEESFPESLRLDHLKGFSFTLSAASAMEVWFDHLALVGDGQLFGAPFSYQNGDDIVLNSWPDATDRSVWKSIYHKSELARDASHEILANDELWLNYTIEDTEPWGGFAEYYHFVPGHGYYNLSEANDVTLGYNVAKPCTAPGEAHLRLVLYDSMHCSANCSDYRQKNVEVYYTFNYVLDDVGEGAFTIPLEGGRDGDSPFLLTGWAGSIHNAVLDPAHIKGFFIGISSDSQGGLGSVLDGIVSVGNLEVTHTQRSVQRENGGAVIEESLNFYAYSQPFVNIPYRSPKACLAACAEDPNCFYGKSGTGFCLLSPSLNASHITISYSLADAEVGSTSFWMNDAQKRGDFCALCECVKNERLIDCKGKSLKIVPETFTVPAGDEEWTPLSLDLRGNPQLLMIGKGSFSSLENSLEILFLPEDLLYLAPGALMDMEVLTNIANSEVLVGATNFIPTKSSVFDDICCGLGSQSNGLTFCELEVVHENGRDSIYYDFAEYVLGERVALLTPNSEFASEASESPEKCAEYCNIFSDCLYFSYDQRVKNAEHLCYLLKGKGRGESYMCCEEDDYADLKRTTPGWTSGIPPRTRNRDLNATVHVSPLALRADSGNKYTVSYDVSLGAMPLRGAVWVSPFIASATELKYELHPSTGVLYDNATSLRFTLQVFNPKSVAGIGETLVITNTLESCDRAFTALGTEHNDVFVRVLYPDKGIFSVVSWITLAVLAVVLGFAALVVMDRRRLANMLEDQDEQAERDELLEIERNTRSDDLRVQVSRAVFVIFLAAAGAVTTTWHQRQSKYEGTAGGMFEVEGSNTSFSLGLGVAFVLLLLSFLIYDWFIRNRNRKLVVDLAKSSEIMSGMFPDQVRDKLLRETRTNKKVTKDKKSEIEAEGEHDAIAELYPNTTICYIVIVGLDAWSSSRKPEDMFVFLERVFGSFDRMARTNKVYKVESSGGCIVYVTGAPNDQADHAQRMCRFVSQCKREFSKLVRHLASTLGADTIKLQLRVGINSGQVTMGVLRSSGAHCQLFGEASNRASRMEVTGQVGKVQLTQETADLLRAAGRVSWAIPRNDTLPSGEHHGFVTYWLDVGAARADKSVVGSEGSLLSLSTGSYQDEDERTFLIEWNTGQLILLLKKIVAHGGNGSLAVHTSDLPTDPFQLGTNETYLDEFADIISLPKSTGVAFDAINVDDIELPWEVTQEVRSLVVRIAALYNDNPFHNFEHASHVTMSILKLLSRIVKPSARDRAGSARNNASLNDYSYGITSDPLTHFAVAFCGMIHDADHPGVPNNRLIKEDPVLGHRFKQRSVAEQNSLKQVFDLLTHDDYRSLRRVLFATEADQERFRLLVVNTVMATDIVDKDLKALRNERWDKAFDTNRKDEPLDDAVNRKATIILEHLIQASDVSHTMQHWNVYRKWNERLLEEMYLAYKEGRAEKDPTENWAAGEIGFFDFYIIPLAKKLKECQVFGVSSDEYLNYAIINRRKWEVEGAAITSEMVERLKNGSHTVQSSEPVRKAPDCRLAVVDEDGKEELV